MNAIEIGVMEELLREALPDSCWQGVRSAGLATKLTVYLDLLERWNAVTNLTSVRNAGEVVRRHFAESLFAGVRLPPCSTMLDLGSGAGLPGVPIQLVRPEVTVTLAESQVKKAAFLREVVRELGIAAQVFGGRSEALPEDSFECVCLRAVDPMGPALVEAARLSLRWVMVIGSGTREAEYVGGLRGWAMRERVEVGRRGSRVFLFEHVPRGTLKASVPRGTLPHVGL